MLTVYQGVVHPWLCDVNGHLTVRHYLGMFDDATYHLYRQVFDYAGPTGKFEGRSWVAVKQTLEYKAELPVGTLIEVRGCLAKIGTVITRCSTRARGSWPRPWTTSPRFLIWPRDGRFR
jgi:acyl-CoA thioester hydrolase